MKRIDLFHDRIFSDLSFASGYYKRNARNIRMMGERYVKMLKATEFSGTRIIDSGCGFGTIAIEIAKAYPEAHVTAVDLSEVLLDMARDLAKKEEVMDRIDFQIMDVQQIDLPDESFDLAVNTFMLHIVEDPVVMLNELERLVVAEGRIMITDLRRNWLGVLMKKLKTALTLEEALAIIERSNLRKGSPSKGPFWWDYMIPGTGS